MTPKPSLKRNALFNFFGSVLPMAVSLVTVPLYLHHLGAARYGVLAIVWMLQGYFGYFDLGMAAATSNRIAQLADASAAERESVLWTALMVNAGFGVIGGALLFALARVLLPLFHPEPAIYAEVVEALPWLACSVPLLTVTGVFAGALTGREQFGILNLVQLVNMMILQITPLVTAIVMGPGLQHVIPTAILGSVVALTLMVAAVAAFFPLRFAGGPRRELVRPLFAYGAWITVTNIAGPLLETADRLLIGSTLGPQAVAWYQVPFNLSIRVRFLPGVIARTLFPRLSALQHAGATEVAIMAARGLAAVMTPLIVFGIFLMQPFIALWTGHAFAVHTTMIGETVLLGVWINSLAHIPGSHLQAMGRPDVVARFHLAELVPFIAFLWWALHTFGLVGAASAWSLRCTVDGVLLFWAARFGPQLTRFLLTPALLVVAAWAARWLFPWPTWPGIAAWVLLTSVALAWAFMVEPRLHRYAQRRWATLAPQRWKRA